MEKDKHLGLRIDSETHGKLKSLAEFEGRSINGCFYQTHRSFIVNMRYVGEFTKDTVKLNLPNGQTCSAYLTKRRYSDFKSNYLLYLESTR